MKGRSGHEPEIRFITSSYDELFRIPDGGTIQVTFPDRQFIERCEYIDDYHMRAGSTVYHICQYAEILERNGGRCEPEPAILLDQAAWQLGHKDYLLIHRNDEGWDYTLYDPNFHEIAGGHIVNPWCSMIEAREEILQKHGQASRVRIRADYDAVEALASLETERIVTEAAATNTTMRSIEDLVEQNDNQFDGIINNLPDEPQAGAPDPGKLARETADALERRSILERLREEEQARATRPPRPFLADRGERSFE